MLATRCASNGAGRDPRNPATKFQATPQAPHTRSVWQQKKYNVLKGSAAKKRPHPNLDTAFHCLQTCRDGFYFFSRAAKGLYVSPSSLLCFERYSLALSCSSLLTTGVREILFSSTSTFSTITGILSPLL